MSNSLMRLLVIAASGLTLFFVGMACNSSSDDPDVCYTYNCGTGLHLYRCIIDFEPAYQCHDTYESGSVWCSTSDGDLDTFLHIPCSGNLVGETGETGGGGVSPWDPSSYVTYNSGTQEYEIDGDFVQAIVENQFVQLATDSARFELMTTGYYKLVDVQSGDLFDELGLETDDVLKSINGYDLDTFEEQIAAYLALQDETEFRLTIDRGTSTLTLDYVIVE